MPKLAILRTIVAILATDLVCCARHTPTVDVHVFSSLIAPTIDRHWSDISLAIELNDGCVTSVRSILLEVELALWIEVNCLGTQSLTIHIHNETLLLGTILKAMCCSNHMLFADHGTSTLHIEAACYIAVTAAEIAPRIDCNNFGVSGVVDHILGVRDITASHNGINT
jgi:hypothetical protein